MPGHNAANSAAPRIDWVDYAKGFCIVMVVMMHSTLGVTAATGESGWMNDLVAFARPFRMPDFFLIAGLFLARVIDRGWRDYLDRKVLHFAYFYALWVTIQFALRAPGMMADTGLAGTLQAYALAFIEPFGTLWFIYLLPVFFVATKLLRTVPWWLVLAVAAGFEIAPVATGYTVIDESAARFVYFFAGYALARHVFRFAAAVDAAPRAGLALLALWALVNGILVAEGLSALPVVSLALGAVGALAVVTAAVLFARVRLFDVLRYCGQNSLAVYLAFSLFMAASRIIGLKTGLVPGHDLLALLVTAAGVTGPLIMERVLRATPGRWLFIRPRWARLAQERAHPSPAPAKA